MRQLLLVAAALAAVGLVAVSADLASPDWGLIGVGVAAALILAVALRPGLARGVARRLGV